MDQQSNSHQSITNGDTELHSDSFGNIIGRGEDAAVKILHNLTELPIIQKWNKLNPIAGIYRQVPLVDVIDLEKINYDLASWHYQHKIDIFILTSTRRIAIRVQHQSGRGSHKGPIKSKRDGVQAWFFQVSNIEMVDLLQNECKNLFKEKTDDDATNEVVESFNKFRVPLPSITS